MDGRNPGGEAQKRKNESYNLKIFKNVRQSKTNDVVSVHTAENPHDTRIEISKITKLLKTETGQKNRMISLEKILKKEQNKPQRRKSGEIAQKMASVG